MDQYTRQYVPFSSQWKMRIDHPYSLVVRDGAVAWSCGQCPLDAEGRVLTPGDLVAQTKCVARFVQNALDSVELASKSVSKIVAYYVDLGARETQQMNSILRSALGDGVLTIPLAVPRFYYDGMLIEIDAHAAAVADTPVRLERRSAGIVLEGVVGDDIAWISLSVNRDVSDTGSPSLTNRIQSLLESFGVGSRDLLSDHWFVADGVDAAPLEALAREGLLSDRGAVAQVGLPENAGILGELTFVRSGSVRTGFVTLRDNSNGAAIRVRKRGRYFWLSGRAHSGNGLVDQTRAAMSAINAEMVGNGWQFGRVCKVTTHYLGTGSEQELNSNMAVRNGYYKRPGPASTGLLVASFPYAESLITMDVLGTEELS